MKLRTTTEAIKALADLGMTENKLRAAIRAGKYPVLKIGTRNMVDVDAVREIIQAERSHALVSIKELSELTGLSVGAIRAAIRSGWILAEKHGRDWRIDKELALAAIKKRMQR